MFNSKKTKNTVKKLLLIFLILIIIGTIGYVLIEGYSFIDALFMTIITISTVGYGTIKQLSDSGIVFTIFLIIASFITVGLIVHNFSRYISDGELAKNLRIRKRKRMMKNIENHTIICGFGRNGSHAATELLENNQQIVVIDDNEKIIQYGVEHFENIAFVKGDARDDEFLEMANIKKAKSIIITLPVDADNLFIVITARQLNPNIKIISRASEDKTERKLRRAGADYVILPDSVGGTRMGKLVFQPEIIEFLEHIIVKSGISVTLTEIHCSDLPKKFIGKSVYDLDIRKKSGANIIGMKFNDGTYNFNPSADIKITKNSILFILGTPEQINLMQKIYIE